METSSSGLQEKQTNVFITDYKDFKRLLQQPGFVDVERMCWTDLPCSLGLDGLHRALFVGHP